ncbi:MAG TPA: TetR/AcrR family transcriptional regulator [bacterium]|nr:TetR/AcrR family transcriptional regulator [bacterium]
MEPLNKREEIIQRAFKIFYDGGFHATGVDTLLADSGISKRTLYKYFRSKEELIAAIVEHYQNLLFQDVSKEMVKRSSDPKEQILYLFDQKREEFEAKNYNGCFAVNAKLEFEGKDKQIEAACKTLYEKLEEFVAALCTQAKCKQPKKVARQIMILFEGAVVLGQMHRDPSIPETAKKLARELLRETVEASR